MKTAGVFSARLLNINKPDDAERELLRVKVDPTGAAMMAPKMLGRSVHLSGLSCGQANILKQEMLSLGGDAAVARGTVTCSIDRTDAILIGTDSQLIKLCRKLGGQPFGLPALAAEIESLLSNAVAAPKVWKTSRRALPLERPLIMGILNVTPDSFTTAKSFMIHSRRLTVPWKWRPREPI